METVSHYIPMDRRFALARSVQLPEQCQGAVLFADISGFTALTETLAQELGPQRGAEEITQRLNEVFGALTTVVHRFGGCIINYSGDAITCWFDEEMVGQKAAVAPAHRATTCAFAMQALMPRFAAITTPGHSTITLRIKTAVTAGTARRLLVGTPPRQHIEVLAGNLLDRMAAAEKQLKSGEIIVGAEIIEQLGNDLVVRNWRLASNDESFAVVMQLKRPSSPTPWPKSPLITADVARPWLLAPVFDRLQQSEAGFLAELRSAVSLFLKFSGLDYDNDPDAGRKLDTFVCRTQEILARYEGHLLQLTMGDKGSYIYGVFGAPIAHEDDSVRAVAAALALQQLPSELPFVQQVQIGLSRGQMHAGAYGGGQRRTYGVLGKEVNIAARLMNQAAPGQILLTERVAKTAATLFTFTPVGEFTLKGVENPLPLYAIASRRDEQTADSLKNRYHMPMVGRDQYTAQLTEQLQSLRLEQSAQCAIIEAEAGMGKSRLIAELLHTADSLNLRAFIGAADAVERTTAYHSWRAIFRDLFNLPTPSSDGPSKQQWRSHIQAWLTAADPDLLPLAPLLNAILPVDFPENEWTTPLSGEVRATNTQELAVRLLAHVTRTEPIVLVLEDAYWMDSASWALTRLVYRDVPGLLLVLATRPLSEMPPEYTLIRNGLHTRFLRLDNLPLLAIETIVGNRLGVTTIPQPVTNLIYQKAAGHPFFSEELASSLYDRGLLQISNGVCQLAPGVNNLQAMNFPDTIQGVITSRIDRLEPRHQLVLKVASVIGRIFAYTPLHDIYPVAQDRSYINDVLQHMEKADFTLLEIPEPDLSYIFKHVITQEVAYSLLLFAQRRQLHRAVAEWYEYTYGHDLAPYYPILAHHWQNAIDTPQKEDVATIKAINYLTEAGQQALRNYANKEAIRFFSQALLLNEQADYPKDNFQRAIWHEGLGKALFFLGNVLDSEQEFKKAVKLLGYPLPRDNGRLGAKLLKESGAQLWHRLRTATAVLTEQQRAIIEHAANCYMQLSSLHYLLNKPGSLLYDSLIALNLLELLPPSVGLAQSYSTMVVLTGVIPHHGWAQAYRQHTERILQQLNEPQAQAASFQRLAIYDIGVASWDNIEELNNSFNIYERIKDMRSWGDSLMTSAHIEFYQSRFQAAADICAQLHEVGAHYENRQHQAWGEGHGGRSLLMQGQTAEGISKVERAIALHGEQFGEADKLIYLGLLSLGYWRRQQYERALDYAQQALPLLRKTQPSIFATREGYIGPAFVFLSAWETANVDNLLSVTPKELQKAAKRVCKYLRGFARVFPIGKPHALIYQAWYNWLAGKQQKALKGWHKAIKTAESLHMPYEAALGHWQIGRHLPVADPARRTHLQQAHDMFQQMDVDYDRQQVQKLLESLT